LECFNGSIRNNELVQWAKLESIALFGREMVMKRQIAVGIVLVTGFSGGVFAAPNCTNPNRVTGSALTTLVSGNTVCATVGTDKWQEQHRSGAQLWDYKKGASDPVDPSKQVGTWGIGANSVTHSYTGGPSYTYTIHDEGGGASYSFCSSGSVVVSGATFKPGNSSCP